MKLSHCFRLGFAAIFLITAMSVHAAPPPVVLKGLDPVLLLTGEEKPGQPAFQSDFGRFRYQFVSAENKRRFDAAPANFAVQFDGNCAMSPSMPGNPEIFTVHEGRIYLAGSEMCLAAVKAEPAEYLTARAAEPRKRVAILIFPGVQIVDYTGPYEVLGQAGYDVFTVAASTDPIVKTS